MTDRRKFIKGTCTACLAWLVVPSMLGMLESCASISVYKASSDNDLIRVPKQQIKAGEKLLIVRSEKLTYDVLLVMNSGKEPYAFVMRCTHQDNILVANNNGLTCNMHGSNFNLDGTVLNGPATRALKKLPVTLSNESFEIRLHG